MLVPSSEHVRRLLQAELREILSVCCGFPGWEKERLGLCSLSPSSADFGLRLSNFNMDADLIQISLQHKSPFNQSETEPAILRSSLPVMPLPWSLAHFE